MSDTSTTDPPAVTNSDRYAFIDTCNEQELKGMLHYLIGYSPDGFDFAVAMVEDDRQAGVSW